MRDKGKKILGIISAVTMLGGAVAFTGCSDEVYKGESLSAGYVSNAEVSSNGGFVVEKGEYVYFINGAEDYTADNTYGDVVRGALMRISKTQLKNGEYDKAQIVVPSLFAAQNFDAGIYIYGDYVYYATPTTDENVDGVVENSLLDFKRAKLDGTEAPMEGYYFRLSSNTANYRFVQVDGVDRNKDGEDDVFCMYEEGGALKSYNTATDENSVLVSGATIYYDQKDPENPNVYYTMSVTYNIEDSAIKHTPGYNQIYCVNAAARATVNADEASYTVEGGKKYDFDKAAMEKANEEAEEAQDEGQDVEIPYDFDDYSTYPYVNLGKLVLDGVGSEKVQSLKPDTRFNEDKAEDGLEPFGYTYTITRYENGGVYFTRAANGSETKLYYLTDNRKSDLNTVTANDFDANVDVDLIANSTTNASSSALFELTEENGERTHSYIYVSGTTFVRAIVGEDGEATEITVAKGVSGTLWQTRGDYLYYYAAGTNGNNISRVNYMGDESDYNGILMLELDEYKPVTVSLVDWNSGWYEPEFIGDTDVLLYCNAQSYGGGDTSYNYIYAAKIGTTDEIKKANDLYEEVSDYLGEYSSNETATKLITYYFRTKGGVSEEVKELYDADFFKEVEEKFAADGELSKETQFINLVGRMSDTHKEEINTLWQDYLLTPEEEAVEEEAGMATWAIVLIVVGSVLVVAAAIGIPAFRMHKKKVAAKREAEATVNAYKRKRIDTTDDKSIDVYADDDEPAEEEKDEE